jgi:restriction system protein
MNVMGRRRNSYKISSAGSWSLIFVLLVVSLLKHIDIKNILIGITLVLIISTALVFIFKYLDRKRYLDSGINEIDMMSGEEFEICLKHHFQNMGYHAETTPRSNDYGADLILKNDNEKIVVQAKRYNSSVGIKAVQEVIGAINYYGANKGMVVTNSYFTPNAINLAKTSDIILWDRNAIITSFCVKEKRLQ